MKTLLIALALLTSISANAASYDSGNYPLINQEYSGIAGHGDTWTQYGMSGNLATCSQNGYGITCN